MPPNDNPKPVDVIAATAFKLDGEHIPVGQLIRGMDGELAKELAGQARVRMATDEELAADAKASAKAKA